MNAKDNYHHTPLHWAASKGGPETVPALIKRGADVNAKTKLGQTPADLAEQLGDTEVLKLLKERERETTGN